MDQKTKMVLYRAWSLRNQFNGAWDRRYFPALARALDSLIPEERFPDDLLPAAIKANRTKALKKLQVSKDRATRPKVGSRR